MGSMHLDMRLLRARKMVVAAITLFSMLFMQLAVASYICPMETIEYAQHSVSAPDTTACHDMDPVDPILCHLYQQSDNQSSAQVPVPPLLAFVPVGFGLPLSPHELTVPSSIQTPEPAFLASATAPPVSIRYCCFRI